MGWNSIKSISETALNKNFNEEMRYYFVHSYYFVPKNKQDYLFTTNYGFDFCSGVKNENIMGVQFHPEKSHRFGMKLYKNFGEL